MIDNTVMNILVLLKFFFFYENYPPESLFEIALYLQYTGVYVLFFFPDTCCNVLSLFVNPAG